MLYSEEGYEEGPEKRTYWIYNQSGSRVFKIIGYGLEVLDGRVLVKNDESEITAVINLALGDSIVEAE